MGAQGKSSHCQGPGLSEEPGTRPVLQKKGAHEHQGHTQFQGGFISVTEKEKSGDNDEEWRGTGYGIIDRQIAVAESAQHAEIIGDCSKPRDQSQRPDLDCRQRIDTKDRQVGRLKYTKVDDHHEDDPFRGRTALYEQFPQRMKPRRDNHQHQDGRAHGAGPWSSIGSAISPTVRAAPGENTSTIRVVGYIDGKDRSKQRNVKRARQGRITIAGAANSVEARYLLTETGFNRQHETARQNLSFR